MVVSEQVQILLDRVGEFSEGAELGSLSCEYHGNTHSLVLTNQGGFDGTSACIVCIVELHRELAKGSDILLRDAKLS